MPTRLELMQTELADVQTKYQSIKNRRAAGETLSDLIDGEADSLHQRGVKLMKLISEAREDERDDDFKKIASFMDDPQYRFPRGGVTDEPADGRKALLAAGW